MQKAWDPNRRSFPARRSRRFDRLKPFDRMDRMQHRERINPCAQRRAAGREFVAWKFLAESSGPSIQLRKVGEYGFADIFALASNPASF